jgi:hypothetical protein
MIRKFYVRASTGLSATSSTMKESISLLEEQVVFPAIVDTLQPRDWADVALTLADRYGPPSTADFEEQFNTLRRNILELEEAAVARRS